MRLVHKESQKIIVEFRGLETIFYNKFLEQEMRNMGILIPHGLRGVYGKDCIKLGDEQFQKAFKEIYYLSFMSPGQFVWEKQ